MTLQAFVDDVGNVMRGKGVTAIYISPQGEKFILGAAAREACVDFEFTPRLKIHGVPVKVHDSLPNGHVWYVIKGAKK